MEENTQLEVDKQEQSENEQWFGYKSYKFAQEWVQVLINLRIKHAKMFTRRRNSASDGWKLVFEEMCELGAPDFITIGKIKKKWMNLMSRFKQIKNSTLQPDKITWPYFDHMNRAFGDKFHIPDENDTKLDIINNNNHNDERQVFIRKLIELRCAHREIFTGKKYTSREGWMIICSLLKCEEKYSVEQLSKCWQNLVQRYKQLSKSENTVIWPYYHNMEYWYKMEHNSRPEIKLETMETSTNVIENESFTSSNKEPQQESSELSEVYENVLLEIKKLKDIEEIHHSAIINKLNSIEGFLKAANRLD